MLILLAVLVAEVLEEDVEAFECLGRGTADGTSLVTAMCDGCESEGRSKKSSAHTQGEASVQNPHPPSTERCLPSGSNEGEESEGVLSDLASWPTDDEDG